MDLGLFLFLAFFAYSSLIIKTQTNSLFIALPILALGIVCSAIIGTYTVSTEQIVLETTSQTALLSNQTNYDNVGVLVSSSLTNSTTTETKPMLNITEEWGVALFTIFHFLLAFVNLVNALYFITDEIKAREQFRKGRI